VNAYDYVRLHSPSLSYGTSTRRLERSLDARERASKPDILSYYADIVRDLEASGNVTFHFNASYEFKVRKLISLDAFKGW
jgi:hypothetical protein